MKRLITSLHPRPLLPSTIGGSDPADTLVYCELRRRVSTYARRQYAAITTDIISHDVAQQRTREGHYCFWQRANGLKNHWYVLDNGAGASRYDWIITGGQLSYQIFHFHSEVQAFLFKTEFDLQYQPTRVRTV